MITLLICAALVVVGLWLEEECISGGIPLALISGSIGVILLVATVVDSCSYYTLLSKRENAVSLQNSIVDVRNAYYKTATVKNAVISGSLENMQQSTVLATYVADCAKAKAEYNQLLITCKAQKTMFVYKWLYTGWAIPKQVLEMETLK